jgi:hypothetical protein
MTAMTNQHAHCDAHPHQQRHRGADRGGAAARAAEFEIEGRSSMTGDKFIKVLGGRR